MRNGLCVFRSGFWVPLGTSPLIRSCPGHLLGYKVLNCILCAASNEGWQTAIRRKSIMYPGAPQRPEAADSLSEVRCQGASVLPKDFWDQSLIPIPALHAQCSLG